VAAPSENGGNGGNGGDETAPTPTVTIDSNDSWQTELNSAGTGAVIGLEAGTYAGFAVTPLTNQKFVALGAVTLDGNGASECFGGHNVRGIEIWGESLLTITDYDPSQYHGAICSLASDWYNNPPWDDGGWLVDDVELSNIQGHGGIILDGNDVIIRNCVIHDIGEIGYKVIFGDDGYVHHCEVYNITPTDWGNEGGVCKNWGTRRLIQEDIDIHDITDGPGIWNDMDNQDSEIRRITSANVDISNIFHEISGPFLIEDCTLVGDGTSYVNGIWSRSGGGIHIVNSGADTWGGTLANQVRNNSISDFYVGIGFLDQERTDQFGNTRTSTTEGEVYGNTLDNCDNNGDARDHNGDQYVLGALGINWHDNTLLNGSSIN
jgi:hypothetical protein